MNFIKYAQYTLLLLMLSPALALAELSSVKVRVSNISQATGNVEITLFDSAESFLNEVYLQQSGMADEEGRFEVEFSGLPDGEYAVVVVHDANDNGKLDNGFLGFGGESYGYSNNAKPWFGRPDFEDVKFTVDQGERLVEIDFD